MRLAFVSEAPVNWCPALGTVLANEEVIDGKSEVGGYPVERRPMRQWMLRITAYAERLIDELEGLDWPEGIKLLQKNWIGRSEGAHVHFVLENFENTPHSLVAMALDTDKADHPARDAVPEGHRVHQTAMLTVFTTRPDTLFGATYMVLSPEHPLVDVFAAAEHREAIARYRAEIGGKSDLERTELSKEKTGVFTGAYAVNPVNGERIPVWIADYVLMGYGTGAIMAVPAHDERDWEFARKFGLPIRQVVVPAAKDVAKAQKYLTELEAMSTGGMITAWTFDDAGEITGCSVNDQVFAEHGMAINSRLLDGLPTAEAKTKVIASLEENTNGERRINYKLRDWLFSRQRYWGEPFPILWEDGKHRSLPESELPLLPPDLADYKPTGTGEPPLAKATAWVRYSEAATRETNTMPQWAGSCWYYLRFCDPRNGERFVDTEAERYWMDGGKTGGVDLYVGGTEHAVLHLLYARFWHKVLFDHGYVSTPEPFQRLVNQGLILGEMQYTAFRRENGEYVSVKDVVNLDEEATDSGKRIVGHTKAAAGQPAEKVIGESVGEDAVNKGPQGFQLTAQPGVYVDARSFKMSKSRGNVINPDAVVAEYGADALRLYEMFMGPLEQTKPWSMAGVQGVARFLARVWRLVMEENQEGQWVLSDAVQDVELNPAQQRVVHATIKKVTEDIDALSFNTAISQMMVCTNELTAATVRPASAVRALLQVLNPFAPHLTEELNETLDARLPNTETGLMANRTWPEYNPAFLVEDEIEIPIQINGKLRERIVVKKDASASEIEALALANAKVQEHLAGKTPRKVIVVPGKLVNVVA